MSAALLSALGGLNPPDPYSTFADSPRGGSGKAAGTGQLSTGGDVGILQLMRRDPLHACPEGMNRRQVSTGAKGRKNKGCAPISTGTRSHGIILLLSWNGQPVSTMIEGMGSGAVEACHSQASFCLAQAISAGRL